MIRMLCPHCGGRARIRTSKRMSESLQEHTVQCLNVDCAHTWVAHTAAVRTIAPSMQPNPKVFIPLSPRASAQRLANAQAELPIGDYRPRAMDSG